MENTLKPPLHGALTPFWGVEEKTPVVPDVESENNRGYAQANAHAQANNITASPPENSLQSYSARDKPWDDHRGDCDDVSMIYASSVDFERYAQRMSDCSGLLQFAWADNIETGVSSLKLRKAQFCRVRHCPVCQWRRSLMWQARFYQALPVIVEQHPSARWIFLTLTVRNMPVTELKSALQHMAKSWQRLIKRKEFKAVLGWIRTTEVTKAKNGFAHPHYHALLMVSPSWFTRDYVKQVRWVELWMESLQIDYLPGANIKVVRPKAGRESLKLTDQLSGAVSETLKYAVKPSDMIDDPDWFLTMTKQVHKLRFVASGGALKDALRPDEEENDDLIVQGDEPQSGENKVSFSWRPTQRIYKKAGF